jgi:hypothetical protein
LNALFVLLAVWLMASLVVLAQPVIPDPLVEIRQCGPPKRDAHGKIVRSQTVRRAFQKIHPCPSTHSRDVADGCPGWEMNHVLPMGYGANGCDAVWNLDWMAVRIKRCKEPYCRDRYEGKIYGQPLVKVIP